MMMYRPCAAPIPARKAAPYPRSLTATTRAPPASASACDPSLEPLSATSTSPAMPALRRNPRAFAMQAPTVAASLRQGIRIVSSVTRASRNAPKKKGTPKGTFFPSSPRLAAAGAGQILLRNSRAGRAALPAPQALAGARGEGRRVGRIRIRNQRDDRAVDDARNVLHGRGHNTVCAGADPGHVLRGLRRGQLATPAVTPGGGGGTGLIHFGDRRTASAHAENDFRHLRADRVVLVRGERHRRQNADDRNHDHQFDQGKALLQRSHWTSPSLGRQKLALGAAKSKGCADYSILHYLTVLQHILLMNP